MRLPSSRKRSLAIQSLSKIAGSRFLFAGGARFRALSACIAAARLRQAGEDAVLRAPQCVPVSCRRRARVPGPRNGASRSVSRIDLSVHLASVSNLHDEHTQRAVLGAGNDAVIADPVLPELAQRGAFGGLSDAARVVQRGHGSRKKTRIRRRGCWSSSSKSRTAALSSSIVCAIAHHHVFERDGVRFCRAGGRPAVVRPGTRPQDRPSVPGWPPRSRPLPSLAWAVSSVSS